MGDSYIFGLLRCIFLSTFLSSVFYWFTLSTCDLSSMLKALDKSKLNLLWSIDFNLWYFMYFLRGMGQSTKRDTWVKQWSDKKWLSSTVFTIGLNSGWDITKSSIWLQVCIDCLVCFTNPKESMKSWNVMLSCISWLSIWKLKSPRSRGCPLFCVMFFRISVSSSQS